MALIRRAWGALAGLARRTPPGTPPKTPDAAAELRNWESELIFLTNEQEKSSLRKLIEQALADTDVDRQRQAADYVRRRLVIAHGPDQVLFPFLGTLATAYIVPCLALLLIRFFVKEFLPLGLPFEIFIWVVIAGTTGGVVRVLRRSVSRAHTSRSKLMLFFEGVIHPLTGMFLGAAAALAFNSGFISLPVTSPSELTVIVPTAATSTAAVATAAHAWTQQESFLVLASFAAGFAEDWVLPLLRRFAPSTTDSTSPK